MSGAAAIEKIISVRHYCFVRGALNQDGDFLMAFRDVNRIYVKLRDRRPDAGTDLAGADVTPRCRHCGADLVGRRAGAEFCDDSCRKACRRQGDSGQLTLLPS